MKFTEEDLMTEDFDGDIFSYLDDSFRNTEAEFAVKIEPYAKKTFFGTTTKYKLYIKSLEKLEE